MQSSGFANLVSDLTLLSHLGVRLVLVHGMRPQIDTQLQQAAIKPRFQQRVRITDSATLPALRNALGQVRTDIESAFSVGLPNTPMSGAQVTLCSGNLVIAKPYGVRNGVDFGHTGEVRRIRSGTIVQMLDLGTIVLLSPIGYSPTGEMFNLHAEEVASHTAVALKADKLIYLHDRAPTGAGESLTRELSATTALTDPPAGVPKALSHFIRLCASACRRGVKRAHLVNSTTDGALLRELFTRDGSGLMIDSGTYDSFRQATNRDVAGIYQLIKPLIEEGILVDRSEQDLERSITDFFVAERDGSIIACASLTHYGDQIELGCLAVHPDFRATGKAAEMLEWLISTINSSHTRYLFALTTRSADWFREHGFEPAARTDLPAERNQRDAISRGSKVFRRPIGTAGCGAAVP